MITLRFAREKDLAVLVQLLEELGYSSDEKTIRNRLSKIRSRNGQVIVAVNDDEQVVGCVQAYLDLRLAEGEMGEIVSLVVKNDVRGQGIGKQLLQEAKNWIAEKGCTKIRVRANVKRDRAHQFYKRQGFDEVKSQKILQANVLKLKKSDEN